MPPTLLPSMGERTCRLLTAVWQVRHSTPDRDLQNDISLLLLHVLTIRYSCTDSELKSFATFVFTVRVRANWSASRSGDATFQPHQPFDLGGLGYAWPCRSHNGCFVVEQRSSDNLLVHLIWHGAAVILESFTQACQTYSQPPDQSLWPTRPWPVG